MVFCLASVLDSGKLFLLLIFHWFAFGKWKILKFTFKGSSVNKNPPTSMNAFKKIWKSHKFFSLSFGKYAIFITVNQPAHHHKLFLGKTKTDGEISRNLFVVYGRSSLIFIEFHKKILASINFSSNQHRNNIKGTSDGFHLVFMVIPFFWKTFLMVRFAFILLTPKI